MDDPEGLGAIIGALNRIAADIDIVFPVHPRTRQMLGQIAGLEISDRLRLADPAGYLEFLGLQRHAAFIITDSGGIQEESTYLGVPCLTVRENTERPVTVTVGSNILVGRDMARLEAEARKILAGEAKSGSVPPLWDGKAGERIAALVARQ